MKNRNINYVVTVILSFSSIFVVLYFFEVNKHEKFVWILYMLYLLFFIGSLRFVQIKKPFLVVNSIILFLWLVTYPIGLVFALIASIGLAVKITLGFYVLPLTSFFLSIRAFKDLSETQTK